MTEVITKWLPLIVAFVAGVFALSQIRSNNITNARLKWLENLKSLLADFFSECMIIELKEGVTKQISTNTENGLISNKANEFLDKTIDSTFEHLKIIESKHTLIKLNLNPKEKLHNKLEGLLDNYMIFFNKIPQQKTPSDLHALQRTLAAYSNTLILLIRYIMKLEWEKTKRSKLSWWYYKKLGSGKHLYFEAVNLELLPEPNIA